MPFETDEEFWKAMVAVRRDVAHGGMFHPLDVGFADIPASWITEPTVKFRCRNDHVGKVPQSTLEIYQDSDIGNATCPHCGQLAFITYPNDHDGPFRLYELVHRAKNMQGREKL